MRAKMLCSVHVSGTIAGEKTSGAGGGPSFRRGAEPDPTDSGPPVRGISRIYAMTQETELSAPLRLQRRVTRTDPYANFGRGVPIFPIGHFGLSGTNNATDLDRPPSPAVLKISPVFIAESVNLGVSRGKDGKFALRGVEHLCGDGAV
jgi:hypothetical protein